MKISPPKSVGDTTDTPTSLVNTFNSWDRLREIIVGDCRRMTAPKRLDDAEISYQSFADNTVHRKVQRFHRYKLNVYASEVGVYPEQVQDERAEDLDNFAKLLESFDVVVKRPRPMAAVQEIKTPDWVNVTSPAGNMRDQFLVIGDEIIETPPQIRGTTEYVPSRWMLPCARSLMKRDCLSSRYSPGHAQSR